MARRSRFIVPKNPREKFLCLFMVVLIPSTVLWEFGIILPKYEDSLNVAVLFHALFCAFVVTNICGNLLLMMRTDASGRHSFLPSVQTSDFRYCSECQVNSPPRAYHCHQCNSCILKRDHHCMFTGCCVGYHNQRYYVVAVVYILIGSTYAALYQWQYCFSVIGGFRLSSFLCLLAPHVALVFGFLDIHGFLVAVIQIVSLLVVAFSGYLTTIQLLVVISGQTQYERKHTIRMYNLGWRRNVADVLGSRWPLIWLFPTVESPLLGDGIRFVTADEHEEPKAI